MDLSKIYRAWTFLFVIFINARYTQQEEESRALSKSSTKRTRDMKRLIFTSHADRKAFAAENIDRFRSHQKHLRRLVRMMIRRSSCDERQTDEVVKLLSQGRFDSQETGKQMHKIRERLGNLTVLCTVRHKKRRRHFLRSGVAPPAAGSKQPTKGQAAAPRPGRFNCTEDIKAFNASQLKGIQDEMTRDKCWNDTDAHIVSRIEQIDKAERQNFRSNKMRAIRLKCKLMKRYHTCQRAEVAKKAKPIPRNPIQEEFWNNFGYPDIDQDESMGLLFY